MLCYVESNKYGNDLALLEDVVATFTYYPLNEICGGFFFGTFNMLTAVKDMDGLHSLYAKTQVQLSLGMCCRWREGDVCGSAL